jgi:hypothetical protein
MMPRRKRTRTEERGRRVTAERRTNQEQLAAEERRKHATGYEPPPF